MKHFVLKEWACPCCGRAEMKPEHMKMIDELRGRVGRPLIITSGFRCMNRHLDIYKRANKRPTLNSAHLLGLATDLKCTDSNLRYRIVKAALEVGFCRIEWGTPTWVHVDSGTEITGHRQDLIFQP